MMDEMKYVLLEERIQSNQLDEKDMQYISTNLRNVLIEYYVENEEHALRQEIQRAKIYQRLLKTNIKDYISYYIGSFSATLLLFDFLLDSKRRKEKTRKNISEARMMAGANKVLNYLYDHPDSQHKIICENTCITKSYLSQLLKELVSRGLVERYATGKRSFFALTLDGQTFIKEHRQKHIKKKAIYPNKYAYRQDTIFDFEHSKYGISEIEEYRRTEVI